MDQKIVFSAFKETRLAGRSFLRTFTITLPTFNTIKLSIYREFNRTSIFKYKILLKLLAVDMILEELSTIY